MPHELLEGKAKLIRGDEKSWQWKTTLAGAFPIQLCRKLAELCGRAAPCLGRRGLAEQEVHGFWLGDLEKRYRTLLPTPPCPVLPEFHHTE